MSMQQLLLVDLCARLHYGLIVKATYKDGKGWKTEDRKFKGLYDDGQVYIDCVYTNIENVKPYLRPIASMTEEEKVEYNIIKCSICPDDEDDYAGFVDWLNEHHFDYRGLIDKGLSIEAPEGMYNLN